jgi:cytochrome c2
MKPLLVIIVLGIAVLLAGCGPSAETKLWAGETTGGSPDKGAVAIKRYGCISCHTIDGISSDALVGPPLTRMASRSYLAGNLQNTAANMVRFIQHPRQIHNDTAMPEMGLSETEARDIAAYLYCFK